jgi:PII-like signaling protein
MRGYQLTFYTQKGRTHGLFSVAEWIMKTAKELGIKGGTLSNAATGFGRDGKYYSAHFFELTEQPVEVTMAVTSEQADALFSKIEEADLKVFFVKIPVEFGITGGGAGV